jgi:hypothetical protein
LIISRSVLLWMRNVSKHVLEKIKTHFVCSVSSFSLENGAVYETSKKVQESDRPQTTVRRMRIACRIPKAAYTVRTCNTLCFSTATMVVRTHRDVTLYIGCLFLNLVVHKLAARRWRVKGLQAMDTRRPPTWVARWLAAGHEIDRNVIRERDRQYGLRHGTT